MVHELCYFCRKNVGFNPKNTVSVPQTASNKVNWSTCDDCLKQGRNILLVHSKKKPAQNPDMFAITQRTKPYGK